eukprot:TRINITY_DN65021_c0_g1_i1.p1 TRINITY_DN65021_c0_g1~~TRINITY_DN65021_c0_g1_i1.p1  ORF type:complete len:532 (-),score=60.96 TRINITY_DN65021_c0_g1_i1:159-1754(-)
MPLLSLTVVACISLSCSPCSPAAKIDTECKILNLSNSNGRLMSARPPANEGVATSFFRNPLVAIGEFVKHAGFGALGWMLGGTDITAFGTQFTYTNYYSHMVDMAIASTGKNQREKILKFFASFARSDNPSIADGPGPNTTTYYGHMQCKESLQELGALLASGQAQKGNELGLALLNDELWPETKTISLGLNTHDHGMVRPFLANTLDGAQRDHEICDGSVCWNAEYLTQTFKANLKERESFASTDIDWIVSRVLHKIMMNMDVTERDAKDVIDIQGQHIKIQGLPPGILANSMIRNALKIDKVGMRKQDWIDRYTTAVKHKYSSESFAANKTKTMILATSYSDALLLAGGLSIPSAIKNMVALAYSADMSQGSGLKDVQLQTDDDLFNFAMETIRRYPVVGAVPFWRQDEKGGWKRNVVSISQALRDERVFPDPKAFLLNRRSHVRADDRFSIAWADYALVNGDNAHPDSRACPAKRLSVQIMMAFIRALRESGTWAIDPPNYKLEEVQNDPFTLKKVTIEEKEEGEETC